MDRNPTRRAFGKPYMPVYVAVPTLAAPASPGSTDFNVTHAVFQLAKALWPDGWVQTNQLSRESTSAAVEDRRDDADGSHLRLPSPSEQYQEKDRADAWPRSRLHQYRRHRWHRRRRSKCGDLISVPFSDLCCYNTCPYCVISFSDLL
jgi:hypothetical protein